MATNDVKAERTKRLFVAALRSELASTGGFTAESVAKRAQTSPATFYNHFQSKEVALAAAFESAMDELVEIVHIGLRIDRLLQKGLEGFCADWAEVCANFFRSNAQLLVLVQAEVRTSETLRDIFANRQLEALQIYEEFIELGQLARVIRAGDAAAIAQMLLIANQTWNHPFLMQAREGDPLHAEMTRVMIQLLTPESPD